LREPKKRARGICDGTFERIPGNTLGARWAGEGAEVGFAAEADGATEPGFRRAAIFHDGPAALRIAMQAVARDIEKNCGQRVRDDGILRSGADSGELLGESFDQSNAQ